MQDITRRVEWRNWQGSCFPARPGWGGHLHSGSILFPHPAVSSQRIILRKQQVIFHIDVVFGRHRGYFPSLSFYNSLLSCLGGEGQLFIQHA